MSVRAGKSWFSTSSIWHLKLIDCPVVCVQIIIIVWYNNHYNRRICCDIMLEIWVWIFYREIISVSYWLKSISSTSILHLHKYIHSHGDTRSCLCRIKSLNSGSDVSTQLTQLGGSDRATQYQPFWSITVVLGLFVAIVQLLSNTLVFSFHTVTEPKHILIQLI